MVSFSLRCMRQAGLLAKLWRGWIIGGAKVINSTIGEGIILRDYTPMRWHKISRDTCPMTSLHLISFPAHRSLVRPPQTGSPDQHLRPSKIARPAEGCTTSTPPVKGNIKSPQRRGKLVRPSACLAIKCLFFLIPRRNPMSNFHPSRPLSVHSLGNDTPDYSTGIRSAGPDKI